MNTYTHVHENPHINTVTYATYIQTYKHHTHTHIDIKGVLLSTSLRTKYF